MEWITGGGSIGGEACSIPSEACSIGGAISWECRVREKRERSSNGAAMEGGAPFEDAELAQAAATAAKEKKMAAAAKEVERRRPRFRRQSLARAEAKRRLGSGRVGKGP